MIDRKDALALLNAAEKQASILADLSEAAEESYILAEFALADVVFAFWPASDDDPSGYFYECVKGAGLTGQLTATAFLVIDQNDAEYLRDSFGDGLIIPPDALNGTINRLH
jgi:hypothetical protein